MIVAKQFWKKSKIGESRYLSKYEIYYFLSFWLFSIF